MAESNDLNKIIVVNDLTIGYTEHPILTQLNFNIQKGQIFMIMGGSGCGKSTLMKALIGLLEPLTGEIYLSGQAINQLKQPQHTPNLASIIGVVFQDGALFSDRTIYENVALPLRIYQNWSESMIADMVFYQLSLVGMQAHAERMPGELSGGMRKRAALARAMVLDPPILFFDEPSAGLDPINAAQLDKLISELAHANQTTIVMISHELESLLGIGDAGIYLSAKEKRITATGAPHWLKEHTTCAETRQFLNRDGGKYAA